MQTIGAGLGHLARRVDFAIGHHDHAFAMSLGRTRNSDGIEQVDRSVGAQRRVWPLGAGHHNRFRAMHREMQKIRRLFQTVGALDQDEPVHLGKAQKAFSS